MPIIRFRCDDAFMEQFDRSAAVLSLSRSQLARATLMQAIKRILQNQDQTPGQLRCDNWEPRDVAVTTRLTCSENDALTLRAKAFGMGRSVWVRRLIRFSLSREPQLSFAEVLALREAVRELLYIGRNLNRIVRLANTYQNAAEELRLKEIREISAKVDEVTDKVGAIIRININRWGV